MTLDELNRGIAKMLAEFERERGVIVKGIDVRTIDVTTVSDSRPQWRRRVLVEFEPVPGTNWET